MNTVNVRKVEIGKGIPKICVPVVGITRDDIIDAACKAKETADLVEWQMCIRDRRLRCSRKSWNRRI